jgi:hypothetical protein
MRSFSMPSLRLVKVMMTNFDAAGLYALGDFPH